MQQGQANLSIVPGKVAAMLQRQMLSDDNIIRILLYYKRMNSHFSFSHHMSKANASYCGVKRNNASSEKAFL